MLDRRGLARSGTPPVICLIKRLVTPVSKDFPAWLLRFSKTSRPSTCLDACLLRAWGVSDPDDRKGCPAFKDESRANFCSLDGMVDCRLLLSIRLPMTPVKHLQYCWSLKLEPEVTVFAEGPTHAHACEFAQPKTIRNDSGCLAMHT